MNKQVWGGKNLPVHIGRPVARKQLQISRDRKWNTFAMTRLSSDVHGSALAEEAMGGRAILQWPQQEQW